LNRPLFARIQARAAAIEEDRGGAELRRRLLEGLSGRVVEVGAGSGVSFAYYPTTVQELVAIEPEPNLREMALEAAHSAPIPVRVLDGTAESLPLEDTSVDAAVIAGVLCSVPDPVGALAEVARVLAPKGELRFYEHVRARNARLERLQRLVDDTFWPRLFGGCHTSRDPYPALAASGFVIEARERFSFRPTVLAIPVAPRVLGRARLG
jgi:ubiquinone/menaquinone biosynthesis C-methylase UbiE